MKVLQTTECKLPVNVRMDPRLIRAIDNDASAGSLTRTDVICNIISSHYGAELPGVCKFCGKWNEVESKFCQECGKELKQ